LWSRGRHVRLGASAQLASAAGTRDPRLVIIALRGGLAALSRGPSAIQTTTAQGSLALSLSGEHPAIPLDTFFALHPAMPVFARLFKEGRAAVVHAAATGYRERSHFDGRTGEAAIPAPASCSRAGSTGARRAARGLAESAHAVASRSDRRRR